MLEVWHLPSSAVPCQSVSDKHFGGTALAGWPKSFNYKRSHLTFCRSKFLFAANGILPFQKYSLLYMTKDVEIGEISKNGEDRKLRLRKKT